jgi:hypothetical protein
VIHEVAEQEGMVGDDQTWFIRASSLPAVPWPFVVGSEATTGRDSNHERACMKRATARGASVD